MGKGPKEAGKPKGKMSAYAFFMQATRDEKKKKNPDESLSLSEFSKQASEKWKNLSDKEKKKFDELAAKDTLRYKEEMADYVPSDNVGEKKRKRGKDPNAPKRALSAFFCFSNEERQKVKAEFPTLSIGDVAKELGKRWEVCKNKDKFEALAAKDKERYEREKASYSGPSTNNGTSKKPSATKKPTKAKAKPPAKKQKAVKEDEEDEEDDEDDENHEDEEEEDESD